MGAKGPKNTRTWGGGGEPQRGKDFNFILDLDFMEAALGCEKQIRLSNGVSYKVKIPPGVKEGAKIRLTGKGEPGLYGGNAGDLFIEPHILSHRYFRRNGEDIEIDLPITFSEALQGATVRVPTLDGSVQLKIPANAQSGQKMRLKGKGIKKEDKTGDLYVILQIRLPASLDEKTKIDLLKILEGKEGDPRTGF